MPNVETSRPASLPDTSKPTFDKERVTVIFVLGGPGAGKGTQSEKMVRDYGFVHLSAGDLLRAEQDRKGSKYGDMIRTHIREGKIVPMEVTVALLENAMREEIKNGKSKFLIDGFPRKLDQAAKFEKDVCESKFTLFFDCKEETMEKRILNRSKTSGREDDNLDSMRKRFRTFLDTSMPVVDAMAERGKVVQINCEQGPEEVYRDVQKHLQERLNL